MVIYVLVMALLLSLLLLLVVLVLFSVVCSGEAAAHDELHRGCFPSGFVFGTASSAYQYEGGVREGGRGASIWDSFTHSNTDKILDGSNGDVAVDFYHLYKEDVKIMKEMGIDAFRFSISWSRILPNGSLSSGVNREGLEFYNNLINELISNGLKPFVTLFHWDTPNGLEDQYGSFLSPLIVEDFRRYADICFRAFGDRVKHWITLNEPLTYSIQGYALGLLAPGRCTPGVYGNCAAGDSGEEPYIVAHHQLLAHAAAVKLYRDKYRASQEGQIGISLATLWAVPFSRSRKDIDAVERVLDFSNGWFLNPITYGDYPLSMRVLVGDRLPKFTKEQSRLMKGSFDFIGVNYYTTNYALSVPSSSSVYKNYYTDYNAYLTGVRNGVPIGPVAGSSWLYVYPPGIRDLLLYIKRKYNNPVIYITENGVDEVNNETLSLGEALKDEMRIEYHDKHLLNVHEAIRKGADVRGYFAWSLLDNFEWSSGYTVRFGIYYVDYRDGLKRYPKSSALWFKKLLKIKGRWLKN